MQNEPRQLLIVLFSNPLDKTVRCERYTHTIGRQTVLGETEIEERGYGDGSCAELFLLLDEVGASDEPDGDFVAECGEEL